MDATFEGRVLGADLVRGLRETQVGLLYEFPARLSAHVITAALLAGVLWNTVDRVILTGWVAANLVVALGRYALARAYRHRDRGDDPMKWAWRFTIGSTAAAALWGAAALCIWFIPDIFHHVLIAFVVIGICSAASAMIYPFLPSLYLFLLVSAGPLTIILLLAGDDTNLVMGVISALLTTLFVVQGRATNATLVKSLVLGEVNRSLVTDLSLARDHLEARVDERTKALDQANETLRAEMAARATTESRLQQAQKMEALGQLTGGVAHDFNNLLAVIQGNTELLAESVKGAAPRREIEAVLHASARGAQLTQRLLTFSRGQALQPRPTNVNDLVTSMTEMLDRTLGADVEVGFAPQPNLPPALVDPGQLENAILNLAINARDAMPDSGRLTIATGSAYLSGDEVHLSPGLSSEPVIPGRYVVLSVSDTGRGIPEENLDKVWEPFFTTKRAGEGSGLGLSMVYGFVRQSGGHVSIDSTVGKGTTVHLFLPHTDASEVALPTREEISGMPSGDEYIFVIEDDAEIRVMVETFLSRLGYRIVTAANVEEVYSGLAENGKPDLFLSDVVLPAGHRGPDIIAGVRRRLGRVKAIFMSGHASGGVVAADGVSQGTILINKPFELAYLARQIRLALDGAGD